MAKTIKPKKPKKPYRDFPLFSHASGRWCKKIRGKHHYFGPWGDPDGALQKYLDQRDDLHAGRTPRVTGDGLTIADLCNRFLTSKQNMLNNGELAERTFRTYFRFCEKVINEFGKNRLVDDLAADDFGRLRASMAETLGLTSLRSGIQNVRVIFKFAFDERLIQHPVDYGRSFNRPSKKLLRQARQQNGRRMFESDQLRKILDSADPIMRAMVLLGINCGFGQTDISNLPEAALDLEEGWVDFPRPKTAIERRIQLWPETIDAMQDAIYNRTQPKDPADEHLVFLTSYGLRWVMISESEKRTWKDSIGKNFSKLLRKLNLKRHGLNFYALRHTFETIGGESKDQVAVNAIMGHVDNSMAGVYRERISDERLQAVTDTVRGWLFAK